MTSPHQIEQALGKTDDTEWNEGAPRALRIPWSLFPVDWRDDLTAKMTFLVTTTAYRLREVESAAAAGLRSAGAEDTAFEVPAPHGGHRRTRRSGGTGRTF